MKGMVGRFALYYVGLTIAAGIILQLISMKTNAGLTVGILMGSAMGAHQAWAKKNERRFEGNERRNAALGMFGVDVLFGVVQFLLIDIKAPEGAAGLVIGVTAVFLLIHFAVIYLALGLSEKGLAKRGVI